MQIIKGERPPNFEAILKVFPLAANKGVIFAYGDRIYVPSGNDLAPELYAHECVHGNRQTLMGVEAWWDAYLADPSFRFSEELVAHVAEYEAICELNNHNRQTRRGALKHVAAKLASPLYGKMMTTKRAQEMIKHAAKY